MDSFLTGFTNLTSRLNPFKQPEAPPPAPTTTAGRRRYKTRKVKRRRTGRKSTRL